MTQIQIIYEDAGLIAINKPAGLQVHAAKHQAQSTKNQASTLADWLLERYPEVGTVGDDPEERPGIVHRLDKDTSGVMLVARNQATFDYLKNLFQTHAIEKTYFALVSDHVKDDEGRIDKPIGIKSGTIRRSVRSSKMAKEAITDYRVIEKLNSKDGVKTTLLVATPKTGRTHQIRVHLASIGHPIVGDPLYGRKNQPKWATRLMLHAVSIELDREPGKRLRLEAPPDEEFAAIIESAKA